jgi:maltooligosyltrehalose trehalohydrolase
MHGAVLAPAAFCLRFFNDDGDRLMVVNLGAQAELTPAPEPLLAPPPGLRWSVEWSSEDPAYGGAGTAPPESPGGAWNLPAEIALVLAPVPLEEDREG